MIVIEKNVGPKIDYEADGCKITFDDDLTINLAKREEDWPVHIDVCKDVDGSLCIGAAAGRSYVAEIDIPKRIYEESGSEVSSEDGEYDSSIAPVPLDMNNVMLTLWAV